MFLNLMFSSISPAYANSGMMSGGMMAGGYMGTPVLMTVFWVVALVDLVLLGVWLFQKISKK